MKKHIFLKVKRLYWVSCSILTMWTTLTSKRKVYTLTIFFGSEYTLTILFYFGQVA